VGKRLFEHVKSVDIWPGLPERKKTGGK